MRYIYSIIKADYLQRTRSYAFLIVLAITIYGAYSFVPPPSAHYTTLNVVGYKGVYNAAWVGHVSAMMTTIMLSLWGFFLINGGIKKDIETEVGLIVATTPITNFGYLLSKFLSNFCVLITIAGCTFVVSIVMFFIRTNGYPFIPSDFIWPYLLFAVPALLTVSALSIVAEVFLGKRSILQYVAFFFLFGIIMANVNGLKNNNVAILEDTFGVRTMTNSIKDKVNAQYHANVTAVNLGFTFHAKDHTFHTFVWNGISYSGLFLFSRLLWIAISFGLVYLSSFFFHRFNIKQTAGKKKKKLLPVNETTVETFIAPAGISMATLPPVVADYGILPFIKTELLLLIRKGPQWFWFVNAGLSLAVLFVPLDIAGILLSILWFLQVNRWSELATKEKANRLHYFTYSSYKPLQRMLPAQILAGVTLAITLALPLLVRYAITLNGYGIINLFNGALFIALMAVCLGIISGGKKLFEILFFLLTYCIIEKIPVLDYFGSMPHSNPLSYIGIMLILNLCLALLSFTVRNYQARHL